MAWLQRSNAISGIAYRAIWLWVAVLGSPAVGVTLWAAWDEFLKASLALQLLVGFGVTVAAVLTIGTVVYWLLTPSRNEDGPRWWRWRKLPLQKISWDFSSSFGSSSKDDRLVRFLSFHPRFKINWGKGIKPRHCYLEFPSKGLKIPVRIEHGNPFLRAERIPFIERQGFMWGGKWLSCSASFRIDRDEDLDAPYFIDDRDAITAAEFFDRFGSFDFVLDYDDKVFRRTFSRERLVSMFRSQIARHGKWAH